MDLSNKGFAQATALVVGLGYAAIGLIGFPITGFANFTSDTGYTLLGLDINPFHNLFHLAAGLYLIIVSQLGRNITEGALIGGGLVYILAAFLGGATDSLQILSMNGTGNLDNLLHLVSGTAALGVGLASVSANASAERRGEPLEGR